MSLKSTFNSPDSDCFRRVSGHQLEVRIVTHNGPNVYTTYDFLTRLMYATTGSSGTSVAVTPFSQMDRESLEFLREKLIELKGKPPELLPLPETDRFMGLKSVPVVKNDGISL